MTQKINWKEKYNKLEKIDEEKTKTLKECLDVWKYTLNLWKYYMKVDWVLTFMLLVIGISFGIVIGSLL